MAGSDKLISRGSDSSFSSMSAITRRAKIYWQGLLDWSRDTLGSSGMISAGDMDLMKVVETPEEAVRIILDYRRTVGVPETIPEAFR